MHVLQKPVLVQGAILPLSEDRSLLPVILQHGKPFGSLPVGSTPSNIKGTFSIDFFTTDLSKLMPKHPSFSICLFNNIFRCSEVFKDHQISVLNKNK